MTESKSDQEKNSPDTPLSQTVADRQKEMRGLMDDVNQDVQDVQSVPNPRTEAETPVGVLNPNPSLWLPEKPLEENLWMDSQEERETPTNPTDSATQDAKLTMAGDPEPGRLPESTPTNEQGRKPRP
jgi:hypothetical protein